MLQDLYRLRDWLKANACEAVAMESTGVFWKPIWKVLEEEMELLLVNAQHMKAVAFAQNGPQRCRVDRRLTPTGIATRQFCARASPTGVTRLDALSQ